MSRFGTVPYANPTLYPEALTNAERSPDFKWHSHAASPRSSQVFCLSAFGTLRSMQERDQILETLFGSAFSGFPKRKRPRRWQITPEAEVPQLLSESGSQPTSIDALCVSSDEVICIESKFATDAKHGFGGCSQFPRSCAGYRGPGSDLAKQTSAWCRLENWDGRRSPRAYWSLGKRWFKPEVFEVQGPQGICPLRGSNYQLMRNFLFAASLAERDGKSEFGLLTIGPRRFAPILIGQVEAFRRDILQESFAHCVAFVDYESYTEVVASMGSEMAVDLAGFLNERIRSVVD